MDLDQEQLDGGCHVNHGMRKPGNSIITVAAFFFKLQEYFCCSKVS